MSRPSTAMASLLLLLLFAVAGLSSAARNLDGDVIKLPSESSRFFHNDGDADGDSVETRWAVLIAGSSGFWNYRHQ
ncbi:hypothetical protein CRG98_007105, partial [Punica granatum]